MRTVTRPDRPRHTVARQRALALGAAALTALLLAPVRSPLAAARPAPATPDGCIAVNGGDWNACNVGHHGRAGQPYARHHAPAVPGTARSTTTS